jgi:hypothetical protein
VRLRVPGVGAARRRRAGVRRERAPRPAEAARAPPRRSTGRTALTALGTQELDVENVQATLGAVLKYHEDLLSVRDETLAGLVASARAK